MPIFVDIYNIELDALLFQTGYLTIDKVSQIGSNYIYESGLKTLPMLILQNITKLIDL